MICGTRELSGPLRWAVHRVLTEVSKHIAEELVLLTQRQEVSAFDLPLFTVRAAQQ